MGLSLGKCFAKKTRYEAIRRTNAPSFLKLTFLHIVRCAANELMDLAPCDELGNPVAQYISWYSRFSFMRSLYCLRVSPVFRGKRSKKGHLMAIAIGIVESFSHKMK